jgi:rhodanese-related sulfurtransferase
VAQQFMKAGYSKVYVLKGGWMAWEKGKNPVEPK